MRKKRMVIKRIIAIGLLLALSMGVMAGCETAKGVYTVAFDTCTNLQTNKIKERTVKAGELVSQPNVYPSEEKYSNYLIEGWYTEPEYVNKWDFTKDVVTRDMILYAKWDKQFLVRYFTSFDRQPRLGVFVAEGDFAEKQEYIIPGYKVMGYYADEGYSIPYDFEKPITGDTDIYIRTSEGLWWDGKTIAENWIVEKATGDSSVLGEISYEEKGKESYARVDFGYNERPDGRIAVFPMMDMTGSQILTIKYKNLGNTPGFRLFWTVVYEDGTVSGQDGDDRTWDFGDVEIKSGMSEKDDWETLTIDMGKLSTINGASQWAGGKILNMLRIDSMYHAGMDKEYVDNVILFKEISFSSGKDYASSDSVKLEGDNVFDVMEVASTQKGIKNGLVFPRDRELSIPKQGTIQYNKKDCVTYFFPYGSKQGLVSYDLRSQNIDMATNQKIYIRYKNEGQGTRLTVRYYSKDGKVGEQTVIMKKMMNAYGTLELNMMNDKDWVGTLQRLDLIYNKKDTNNILSVSDIYLAPFKATDIPGINFVDDKCAGFETNKEYKIAYDAKSEATFIEMGKNTVVFEKKVSFDTSVYSSLEFTYSIPTAGIDVIELGYQVGGVWYTEKVKDVKRTSGFETVSFDIKKKGAVTAMRIKLNGKGRISIRSLQFKVDPKYALDLSTGTYVSDHFNLLWLVNYGINHDSTKGAAVLEGSAAADARVMFYLGASGFMENIPLDSADKKVYVCYNNPGEARTVALNVFYAGGDNIHGSGMVGDDSSVSETKGVATTAKLKGNMKEGEWAVAVFDFSDLKLFSADRNATMISLAPGGELYLRSIVLK